MLRVIVVIAALGLAGAGPAPQDMPPPLPPELSALLENEPAAQAFDYMALKVAGADLRALSGAVYRQAGPAPGEIRRCLTDGELAILGGLAGARAAPDQATFDADREAAVTALAQWDAFAAALPTGPRPTEQPLLALFELNERAAQAGTDRERQLHARRARDQAIRIAWEAGNQVWEPLTPGARARVELGLSRRMCEVDGDNTAWLKTDIAANGWYRISAFGPEASRAAWLLVQHADRDPAFQTEVLAMLEPLAREGEIEPWHYAYLYDRVAVNTGGLQRYGSQGRCVARGVWGPQPLEDPERVEALRAAFEMGPLSEYAAHMHRFCSDYEG